ncbi:MAG: PAS domain S-box protein, partial [Rhodospirillaceae bacterium]|nr:PAS domain S-box protein [Rhodospirillaceae bacterium]
MNIINNKTGPIKAISQPGSGPESANAHSSSQSSSQPLNQPSRRPMARLLNLFLAPLAIAIFLVAVSQFNFLSFHTIAELFAIVVAVAMFFIAWNTYSFSQDNFLMFLASGYFWIASLDLIHTLSYPGINIFQNTGTNVAVQFWIVARYFEALLLLFAPLFFVRKIKAGILFSTFGAVTVLAYSLIEMGYAPVLFIEGVGLQPIKIYSEYIIIGILAFALLHLSLNRAHLSNNIFYALVASIVLTMIAELAFTLYISALGLSNLVGHIFKFTSYWLILGVIIRTTLVGPYIDLRSENKERKEAEEELDSFFSLTFDMQCIAGIDGYFKRLNYAWVDTLGFTMEELKSRPFVDFVHEDDREATTHAAQKLASGVSVVEFENRYQKKDGTYAWLLWNATLDSARGQIYATARNITQRKHRQQELEKTVEARTLEVRASEKRLQLILDNVVDSIITSDSNGIIVSCNPGTEKIFGYSKDEMIGQNLSLLMPKNEAAAHDTHMSTYIKTHVPKIIGKGRELEGKRKDGTVFPIDIAISKLEIDGDMVFIGIIRDITERKKVEHELQHAKEDADKANMAKSEFLSSMSHELRTPLNAIIGFSQLLEMGEPPLTETRLDQVAQIRKGGSHLLSLINDILELAKIEAGKINVSIEPVPVDVVVSECLELIGPQSESSGLTLEDKTTLSEIMVIADQVRLRQCLLNLLSNAVKYNRPGGVISLSTKQLDENIFRFLVSDTGIGIPLKQQSKVFEPFNRLGAETTEIEGTGIGLSLTKSLIEQMGGGIGFSSTQGEGSVFWIDLPISQQKEGAETSDRAPIQHSFSPQSDSIAVEVKSLLYVEDNVSNIRVMQGIIDNIPNIKLITAQSAEEGIETAVREMPDIIIMDGDLP